MSHHDSKHSCPLGLGKCLHLYLDFKGEIFLEVFDDHDEERKPDAQCLLGVCRTCYIGGTAGMTEQKLTEGKDEGD